MPMTWPLLATLAFAQVDLPEPPPDASKTAIKPLIVYLGDSHSAQWFGQTLDPLMRDAFKSYDVEFHARCSASPNWFYHGTKTSCGWYDHMPGKAPVKNKEPEREDPKASPVLSKKGPPLTLDGSPRDAARVVVIALGSNGSLAVDEGKRWVGAGGLAAEAGLAKLIVGMGLKCVWIGNPHFLPDPQWRGFTGAAEASKKVSEKLKGLVTDAGCAFIDSYAITEPLKKGHEIDQLHYGKDAGVQWANAVNAELKKLIP